MCRRKGVPAVRRVQSATDLTACDADLSVPMLDYAWARSTPRGGSGGAGELCGEELERRLRLRLLFAEEVEAFAGEERLHLDRQVEGLGRQTLRRELEDARPVRVEPELGHEPPGEALRRVL